MKFSREMKVGVFVLMGIIIVGVVVFLIGQERSIFSRHVEYITTFSDVQGLKTGAPIRLSGIDVGTVGEVSHSANLNDPRIHVELSLVRSEATRVRANATAKIVNKGLLGDKMVEIIPGTNDKPPFSGTIIPGEDPTDFSNLVSQVEPIAEKTNRVLGNLEHMSKNLASEELNEDLRGSFRSVHFILKEVAEGKGYLHRLLSDPGEAERLSRAIGNLDKTSAELSAAAAQIRQVITRVNEGPGFAHDLVYSDEGTKTLTSLGDVAGEVSTTLRGVREGKGLARSVLYGDGEQAQMMNNLTKISGDVRDIVAGVKSGKGTIGALLVDPSVYEDMKLLLGNVERNETLRALVRFSIKQDEKKPSVDVRDPAAPAKPR